MNTKLLGAVSVAALVLGATGALAQASVTEDELAELRQRIDTLEQQQKEQEQAAANAPSGFQLRVVESLGDPDQIGQRNGLGRLSFGLGEATTITLYGFVRAEAFYDFDFQQGDLSTASAVGDPALATSGEFDTSVRVSRFGIRSSSETDIGTVGTQLEFDLFGSGGDQSSSPNLRLRHANITVDTGASEVLVGQFWTNFMPLVHYPTTADFNGPVGISFARVPQIRYTYDTGNGFAFSTSLEERNGGSSSDPIVTAAAFYGTDLYSVRIAGLAGTFNEGGVELDTSGITVSGSITPWQGGTFSATYVSGEALGNLLIGGGDTSVGGVENDVDGFTLEYRQDIGDKWNVGIAYGSEDYDLPSQIGASANSFTDLESIHVNAFYTPVENFTIGIEYINIESEGPGFSADADRVGLSATFRF